jgi:hypothetical protein
MVKKRVVAALVILGACKPEFSDRTSEVSNYRVLAVQSEPAEWQRIIDPDTNEAKPAKFSALVVDPLGNVANASLEWAFCTLPKPLTELNDVSIACFQNDPTFIVALGSGPSAAGAVPENTCRQFGPEVPENQNYRPADPDVTGGYYQPLRVMYRPTPQSVVPTVAKVRIHCGLAGASQDQTAQFNRMYHANTNPRIDAVQANGAPVASLEADPNAAPLVLARGASVTLRVTWPTCPLTDACGDGTCGPTETKEVGDGSCTQDCQTEKACGGAERFLSFSLETRVLSEQREVMRVSWFTAANGPAFHDDRTGRDAADPATFSDNVLIAPSTPGTYPVWAVLRDSRGGVTWSSFRVQVP